MSKKSYVNLVNIVYRGYCVYTEQFTLYSVRQRMKLIITKVSHMIDCITQSNANTQLLQEDTHMYTCTHVHMYICTIRNIHCTLYYVHCIDYSIK